MEFKQMLRKVAAALDLTPEIILEPTMHRERVDARYILYLLLDEKNEAPPDIAQRFNQHRTTVIYGQNQARHMLTSNRFFKAKYEKCKAAMNQS